MNELENLQKRLETEKDIKDAIFCTIEEMSEVTKVLTKFLRNSHKFTIEDLTEETAHSLLMLKCIQNMFKIKQEDIEQEQIRALKKCFKMI